MRFLTLGLLAVFGAIAHSSNAPPVQVGFYSESYCPGCEAYSTTQLHEILGDNQKAGNGVAAIMVLTAYPYGNAQEKQMADGSWTFTCQHGNNECIGNMYEACAQEHYPSVNATTNVPLWWDFFYCLELSGNAGITSTAQNCANKNGIDWNVITTCAGSNPAVGSSTDGNPLMHKTAVATNSLVPPHQWTPWVVVNGAPLTSAQLNLSLTPIVCKAYTGTDKPAACGTNAEVSAQQ